MGILFGGWSKEDEGKSVEELSREIGWRSGIQRGFNDGLRRAQQVVIRDTKLSHQDKNRLWDELEKKMWN